MVIFNGSYGNEEKDISVGNEGRDRFICVTGHKMLDFDNQLDVKYN